jgi:hypothetical protein
MLKPGEAAWNAQVKIGDDGIRNPKEYGHNKQVHLIPHGIGYAIAAGGFYQPDRTCTHRNNAPFFFSCLIQRDSCLLAHLSIFGVNDMFCRVFLLDRTEGIESDMEGDNAVLIPREVSL